MSIKNKVCRIVDHPVGWRPPVTLLNKLVRSIEPTPAPRCCLSHLLRYTMCILDNGELWNVEALQHLNINDGVMVTPGNRACIPRKNLSPLPDVDDDEDTDKGADKPIEKTKERELEVIK